MPRRLSRRPVDAAARLFVTSSSPVSAGVPGQRFLTETIPTEPPPPPPPPRPAEPPPSRDLRPVTGAAWGRAEGDVWAAGMSKLLVRRAAAAERRENKMDATCVKLDGRPALGQRPGGGARCRPVMGVEFHMAAGAGPVDGLRLRLTRRYAGGPAAAAAAERTARRPWPAAGRAPRGGPYRRQTAIVSVRRTEASWC